MLAPTSTLKIFAFREPADMRKNFDGLAALVERHAQDPLSGSLFLFRNRRGDRLKILYWDGDGYALWYKRLEQGSFQFPATQGAHAAISLTDLAMLLDGVDFASIRRRRRYRREPLLLSSTN